MKELKCPHCGKVFSIDEAEYAALLTQVRTAEFDAEITRRMAEQASRQATEQKLAAAKAEQDYQARLSKKELEIGAKAAEIDRLKGEAARALAQLQNDKDAEIAQLRMQLSGLDEKKASELAVALAEKDRQITALNATLAQKESQRQIAVMEERSRAQRDLQNKETEITRLRAEAEMEKNRVQLHESELIKQHENELRAKQELVDYYKDLKTRMSTKMIGETLEVHCSTLFNQMLRPIMPTAYFEKDNDVTEGTKGDFIFRDSDDGVEYISIMFEMKNEMDTTAARHRNEDFLKKLDEDRRKKKCEFAVLVSLLEPESELYNGGIVDMSHRFEKMYVIRPQFFIPIITLLVQTSKKTLEYQRQLILAQSKEVDVTNFENKLLDFKEQFGRHMDLASRKFGDAIKQIDDTIVKLQKIKESFLGTDRYLRLANQDTEELTIRKLTYRNPTMKAKFDEARQDATDV